MLEVMVDYFVFASQESHETRPGRTSTPGGGGSGGSGGVSGRSHCASIPVVPCTLAASSSLANSLDKTQCGSGIEHMVSNAVRPIGTVHFEIPIKRLPEGSDRLMIHEYYQ